MEGGCFDLYEWDDRLSIACQVSERRQLAAGRAMIGMEDMYGGFIRRRRRDQDNMRVDHFDGASISQLILASLDTTPSPGLIPGPLE